ncbi:MAG: hypothetical protein U0324_36470 [Polyangiales bacterium]
MRRVALAAALVALAACSGDHRALAPPQECTDAGRCDGACVDPQTDLLNCGGCGITCPDPGAGRVAVCNEGRCGAACAVGRADCDGDVANGCEADLGSTATCGACGNACRAPAGGSVRCEGGACRARCDEGRADCDGDEANGCEVALATSLAHCGECGHRCAFANAAARCGAGSCAMGACADGFGDCDGDPATGCEADLRASDRHCGACGRSCDPAPNTSAACAMGACVRACLPGFADCDGAPANGCEVDLRADPAHCGSCETRCAFPGATARCDMGACALARCDDGRGDCDGAPANGCETLLATAVAHCGACGRACPAPAGAAATCTAGACGFRCLGGLGDCDGSAANGCEADLDTSRDHCGRCLNRCAGADRVAAAVCVGGGCRATTCSPGWRDCNGQWADGCEVALGAPENCAGCGDRCPATLPRCVASGASFTCAPR